MKNINKFLKILSVFLAALMLAASFTLIGCSEATADDHDHDHDHEEEDLSAAISAMYPDVSLLSYPEGYPLVSAYSKSEVKKELYSTGPIVLRVVKIEDGQYYCTGGKSTLVNYVLIDPPVDMAVGEFLLINTPTYLISSERFGFSYGKAFESFYVVFGNEAELPQKIDAAQAYNIYSQIPSIQ